MAYYIDKEFETEIANIIQYTVLNMMDKSLDSMPHALNSLD